MDAGFSFSVIWDNITYFLIGRFPHGPLGGTALTLYLAVVSCVLSFFGGMVLGLLCISHNRTVKYSSLAVINIIRGMPLLMVIFWMYFLLPAFMGGTVSENWTVIMALTLFTSAYMSQIVKAGIEGIPSGPGRSCHLYRPPPLAGHDLYRPSPGAPKYDPLLCKPVRLPHQGYLPRFYCRCLGVDPCGYPDQ